MSDLISRQDAIDAILYVVPSAESEQKKGEWVKDEHTYSGPNTYNYVCSSCGAIGGSWLRDLPKNLMYPFCPYCGADMRGNDEMR